jgi:Fe-S-cluster containining protein
MSQPKQPSPPEGRPQRLSFELDEAVFPWLSLLLDAYHTVDRGVAAGIARERRRGRQLACAKGCSHCCRSHTTIPVYPLELVGLTWYAAEQLTGPMRDRVREQLRGHRKGEPCPFLVDGVCAVHPLRPMACRQFNVFGRACGEGEDAYYSRRRDVLTPNPKYADEAFFAMLPFYGVEDPRQRRELVRSGAARRMAQVLQECNWGSVADKMDAYDQRHTGRDGAW